MQKVELLHTWENRKPQCVFLSEYHHRKYGYTCPSHPTRTRSMVGTHAYCKLGSRMQKVELLHTWENRKSHCVFSFGYRRRKTGYTCPSCSTMTRSMVGTHAYCKFDSQIQTDELLNMRKNRKSHCVFSSGYRRRKSGYTCPSCSTMTCSMSRASYCKLDSQIQTDELLNMRKNRKSHCVFSSGYHRHKPSYTCPSCSTMTCSMLPLLFCSLPPLLTMAHSPAKLGKPAPGTRRRLSLYSFL